MRAISILLLLVATPACGGGDDDMTVPDSGPMTDGAMSADGGPDAGPAECATRPTDAPGPRGEVSGVFDPVRDRIVVFGGNTSAPVMCSPRYTQTDELWAFHLDCNNWERISPASSPPARSRHATAFDGMRQRMIVFGGQQGDPFAGATLFNDVWALDLATDTWEELVTSGASPSVRAFPAMVYDEAKDWILVHGGDSGGFNGLGDMYALDLGTLAWSEIDTTGGPPPRLYHGAVVHDGRMVIFGGAGGFDASSYTNDVWAFDSRDRHLGDGPRRRLGLTADAVRCADLLRRGERPNRDVRRARLHEPRQQQRRSGVRVRRRRVEHSPTR